MNWEKYALAFIVAIITILNGLALYHALIERDWLWASVCVVGVSIMWWNLADSKIRRKR